MNTKTWGAFLLSVCLMVGEGVFAIAWSTLSTWKVGKSGVPWSQGGALLGMETVEGFLQPVEFLSANNITQQIKWHDEKPTSFAQEGDGYVWDNAAFHESDLVLIDRDPNTSTGNRFKSILVNQTGRTFYLDLGIPRFVSRLVFYPRQSGEDESGHPYKDDFIRGFQVSISDGASFDRTGNPLFSLLRENPWNTQNSIVDLRFSLQPIRFIRLRVTSRLPFEIAEIELYGEGFMKHSKYVSDVMDLGDLANFGRIEWSVTRWRKTGEAIQAASDAPISVTVETRSGKDDTPLIYYKKEGDKEEEVAKEVYDKLPAIQKGPVVEDTEHWSLWSLPYGHSGERITSPSPRRYVQFRIELKSTSIWEFGRMDSLFFQYSAPSLAQEVRGEVALLDAPSPEDGITTVATGRPETFSYDIRAQIESSQYGFDAVRIETPSTPTFRRLERGDVSIEPDSVMNGPNYLEVRFPSHGLSYEDHPRLRVVFDAEVLLYGTSFGGTVFKLDAQELPQPIVEGNANDAVTTNTLRVLVTRQSLGDIFSDLQVSPDPITPNEDGQNDRAIISYTIAQLREERLVDIGIYDLAGRLVKRVSDHVQRGIHRMEWDGRDEDGSLVPPGVYICRVSIRTDKTSFDRSKTITVTY